MSCKEAGLLHTHFLRCAVPVCVGSSCMPQLAHLHQACSDRHLLLGQHNATVSVLLSLLWRPSGAPWVAEVSHPDSNAAPLQCHMCPMCSMCRCSSRPSRCPRLCRRCIGSGHAWDATVRWAEHKGCINTLSSCFDVG